MVKQINKTAFDPQLRRIQELELQLKEAKEDNDILKKVNSSMNIQRFCSLFNVPLSSYYKALEEHVSNPNTDLIITRMHALHAEHIHCLGRRKMHKEQIKEGFTIGTFKVAKLMKDAGIIAKTPTKPHYYPACNEKPNIANIKKTKFHSDT